QRRHQDDRLRLRHRPGGGGRLGHQRRAQEADAAELPHAVRPGQARQRQVAGVGGGVRRMSTLRAFDERIRQVRGALTVLVVVVALTLAGCTAGLVWQSLHTPSAEDLNEVRTEALAAGRSSAKTLLSYDHRTLDKDFAAGRRVATGEFKQQYT